jgi:hypothetical protein
MSLPSTPRRLRLALLLTFLVAACSPTRGCSESQFKLAADSRLPAWINLPTGMERQGVDVELWYWTPIADVDDVTVYVKDRNGRSVANLTARSCWHPAIGPTVARSLQIRTTSFSPWAT